jgi:hypothetical protein
MLAPTSVEGQSPSLVLHVLVLHGKIELRLQGGGAIGLW